MYGPYAYGRIVQVPNRKKNIPDYIIEYDKEKDLVDGVTHEDLCSTIPSSAVTKQLLKRGVERANIIDYRYKDRSKRRKRKGAGSAKAIEAETVTDSVFLGGILNENDDGTSNSQGPGGVTNESDDESLSDEGSDCELDVSAFRVDEDADEDGRSPIGDLVDNERENNFMGNEWKWNCWEDIGNDEEVDGPLETDRYNGPHGLKNGVGNRFKTIFQCIMTTTAMNIEFFRRLVANSNKYARNDMQSRNSTLYLGHKWENISVSEMIRFFGIMLRISLEPRKMGGYSSYFTDNSNVQIGTGYSVELRGYSAWAKDIMTLVRFKQIRSALHPESGESQCHDKCHQLRYFIRMFNYMARDVFHLGPDVSFDEGGVAMRSRYCPVRQYNKDKPEKFRVDFFIMADATHYFIYHLDVYQGKNKANIDISPTLHKLPTTQKAVANAIVKSQISNDKDGSRHIYMDNRYAAPQLFAIMVTNYNVRGVGTCKANRLGYDSEKLQLPNPCDRGTFIRKVDKRLGMVITRWKDSKTLQTVSTVMKGGIGEVSRRTGAKIITVPCPNDIIMYQKNMDGVDRGDQHRVIGAGFANVAHFKKWYKKAFLGICDFSFLNAFTAWNLSVTESDRTRRGGIQQRNKLLKWEFYSVAAEEMMTYSDGEDNILQARQLHVQNHVPIPIPRDKKEGNIIKAPTCMICSLEEGVMRSVIDHPRKKARKYSRRLTHLSICADPNCNIVCHSCCPTESRMNRLSIFKGLSCFEIAHHEYCKDVFVEIERKGKKYTRARRKHPIHEEIANLYSDLKQREDQPIRVVRRGRPRSEQDSANATLRDVDETPVDRIRVSTTESVSVLGNSPQTSVAFRPMPTARIQTRSRTNTKKQSQSKKAQSPMRRSKRIRK